MAKIFIFGSTGMLGWITCHYLDSLKKYEIVPLGRQDFNAISDKIISLKDKYKIEKNDLVINAIGLINRHVGKVRDSDFFSVNADFPIALDKLAGQIGCKFVHVTTDCVYKGDIGGYWESAPKDSDDIYARSKIKGEELKNAIILRTSIVGVEKNHFYSLLSWVMQQNGNDINGYTNHTWNGITTLRFAKIIENFLEVSFPEPGIYHVFSKRMVTKFELIEMIARIFESKVKIKLHQTKKPLLRHLSTEKTLCQSLCIGDIEDQLVDLKKYCQDNNIPWKYT